MSSRSASRTGKRAQVTAQRRLPAARRLYAGAVGAALLAGALLIALSQISAHRGTTSAADPGVQVAGAAATAALLDGIPQRANVLGSAKARVRLVEYTDIQCPFCAQFAVEVLPALVREYVRPGDVQIELRGLAFLGPGSVTALQTATAAGNEGRMWNVAELLFANQGPENAWVTDTLLRSIVTAAGADAGRAFAGRDGSAVRAAIVGWTRRAQADGVSGTPTFFAGPRSGPLQRVSLSAMTVDQFRAALDGALGR